MITRLIQKIRPTIWAYGLFWSWNLIFLGFMLLGFAPTVLPDMITAAQSGEIPLVFPLFALVLTLIPLAAVSLGATIFRRSPGRLFALGYGIEWPLMLLLAIRFFALGEMTPAVALLMTIAGLGLLTFLWQLLDRWIDSRGSFLTHLRVIGLTLLLLAGLYTGVWIAFYAIPMVGAVVIWFFETLLRLPSFLRDLLRGLWDFLAIGPFFMVASILMFYSATLFVLMPLALPVLCLRAWRQGLRALAGRNGRAWAISLTASTTILCIGLLVLANRQPQRQAFALLEEPPASLAEAEALLAEAETIRQGLLNAYLAPFRYFSAAGEVYHISELYESTFGLSRQQAGQVQGLYELVVRPVLYVPVERYEGGNRWENQALREEPLKAAEKYEQFFDQTIIEGELETIVQTVRATWSTDRAQAAWQAVDDREVYLTRQEVNVTEQGDWAEIELYEVYENQTTQRQEVVYYFSLPESATITGVWLGNSPDREDRFVYRVSPRGAAQDLYQSEVRRNMDPALVEQIGPRQYRLRIFPVEPERWTWEDDSSRARVEAGPPLHVWLTWRVLAQENSWPLPRVAERRNVYWDAASVRLVNGQPMAADAETWLPAAVPATTAVTPVAHRIDFSNGETVLLQPVGGETLPELPTDLRLAVVLDRSRSMVAQAAAVEVALARLAEATGENMDIYLTASLYRGEPASRVTAAEFDPASLLYYGGQDAAELLVQFDTLQAGEGYDAVIVLTDGAGYELGEGALRVPAPAAPVWMVHLGGDFPLGYDDPTLEAIQASGGGVAGSVEEALTRLAMALSTPQAVQSEAATLDVLDGYTWLTLPTAEVEAAFGNTIKTEPVDSPFIALAARRLILAEMQRQRAGLSQLATLDQLHAIAIEHSLVTPYSSMIVLVNEAQQRRLDQLEAQGDRFEREVEAVGETPDFSVTGVPEPEEWLLLALAAGMLAWYGYGRLRQRRAWSKLGM
jgi:putative PEP-CTERM system integral membrane protein